LKPDDLIIAWAQPSPIKCAALITFISFVGPSGSGKSQVCHQRLLSSPVHLSNRLLVKQIIDTLTGQRGTRAHSNIGVINRSIVAFRVLNHEIFESRLVLIETPASDYAGTSEVIEVLADFLPIGYVASSASSLKIYNDFLCESVRLSAIVDVHRINDNRITTEFPYEMRSLRILLGPRWERSVVFVTTMWDTLRDHNFGARRQERMQRRWGGSATFLRFLDTPESAWDIIYRLPLLEKDKVKSSSRIIQTGCLIM